MRFVLATALLSFLTGVSAYCNWNDCNNVTQGGDWCNVNAHRCVSCGHGASAWCDAPYCAPDSSCDGTLVNDVLCNDSPLDCSNCGGHWCSDTPSKADTFAIPTSGVATTTRYWDCSGGACACAYVPEGMTDPSHCYSNALFAAPEGNPYGARFYGTAAVSQMLGGGDWLFPSCGRCWKVTGRSITGSATTLVLRAANYCPPGNAVCNGKAHFDIAAPGFDFLGASLANTCKKVEPGEADGFGSCGRWMIDSKDPTENCDCSLFNDPVLRAGCENFLSLQWDNPRVDFEEVECPAEMVTECGFPYPAAGPIEGTCASPGDMPTFSPVETPSPIETPSPTTASPVETPSPVTPMPVNPPSGKECCTSDLATCMEGWCSDLAGNCASCGDVAWIEPMTDCIPLYGDCTRAPDNCCTDPKKPITCQGDQYYKQCRKA